MATLLDDYAICDWNFLIAARTEELLTISKLSDSCLTFLSTESELFHQIVLITQIIVDGVNLIPCMLGENCFSQAGCDTKMMNQYLAFLMLDRFHLGSIKHQVKATIRIGGANLLSLIGATLPPLHVNLI